MERTAFYFVFLLLGLVPGPALGQFATVRGRVVDASDGQPLQGVNLVVDDGAGARTGTATGADGAFVLARIPPGRYVLTASFVGYATRVDTLALDFGETHTLNLKLEPDEQLLAELVVESEAGGTVGGGAGFERIRPGMLERVPMPDVSADLMAHLLTLPGVVSVGDRGGQLFVRGGTPTQNLVLVDGMRVFQPFHIIGFYSIFPADILAQADLYAGGFGARYGGRISSVLDVSTRNGSKERVQGAVSLAPFLSAVRLEAPVVPGKVSVLASARESVIERIAPLVLGRGLPYRFGDVFVKAHAYLNQTSSFAATALRTYDQGDIADTEGGVQTSRWTNQAVGLRYTYLPPDAPVMTQLAVYTSQFDSRYTPVVDQERRAAVETLAADLQFAYLLGAHQLQIGMFGSSMTFRYDLTGLQAGDTRESVSEGGLFVDGRFGLGAGLRVEPGVRLQAYSHGVAPAVEPRLRLQWRPGGAAGRQQFSAAWGRYHQQIVGLNNPRDVTEAFVAWAPSPANQPVPRATHVLAGWQRKLGPSLDVSVEAFHKRLENLSFPRFDAAIDVPGRIDRVTGTVRGLEVRLEASRAWFYGYVGYGLGRVTYAWDAVPGAVLPETAAPRRFSPPHDRRHQLNVLVQAARGPYRLGLRWQYGSGLPFTQVYGYYDVLPTPDPDHDAHHTQHGSPRVAYADLYAARLPPYHRLDVSFERRFDARRYAATLQASLVNAYDRANIFNYDLLTQRRVDQLPLLPSVGLKVELR